MNEKELKEWFTVLQRQGWQPRDDGINWVKQGYVLKAPGDYGRCI